MIDTKRYHLFMYVCDASIDGGIGLVYSFFLSLCVRGKEICTGKKTKDFWRQCNFCNIFVLVWTQFKWYNLRIWQLVMTLETIFHILTAKTYLKLNHFLQNLHCWLFCTILNAITIIFYRKLLLKVSLPWQVNVLLVFWHFTVISFFTVQSRSAQKFWVSKECSGV